MGTTVKVVDSISNHVAKISHWLCVVLVLIMTYEVIMRYAFNSPTMWAYQTGMMIGTAIYVLSWAWIHRQDGHIRIDVFYSHLSPRKRAIIDVIGTLLLFLPLMAVIIETALGWTIKSWEIREKMSETYWMPPAYHLRTVVLIGFCLFAIQGLVQLYRAFYRLVRNQPYD